MEQTLRQMAGQIMIQALAAVQPDAAVRSALEQAERRRFFALLQSIPFLRVIPSQANYFLCEVLSPYTSHGLVAAMLRRYNILLKD